MQTTRLNHLDATFLNIERPQDPWSIHLELRLEGRVDEDRLEAALRHAQQLHPMARARLQPYGAGARTYSWEIPAEPGDLPLQVAGAGSDEELDTLRDGLLGTSVPLQSPPGFRLLLAHHPDGDRLMMNLNHTLADGLSAFRILTSIVRHYAGDEDPVPDVDPLAARDLKALAASGGSLERLERLRLFAGYLIRSTTPPVRVQARGVNVRHPDDAPGYGVELIPLSAEDTTRFLHRRVKPATVNDMLIAALVLAIREWNRRAGGRAGKVSVMMPVNLRRQDWWFEVVGNFSSYVNVILDDGQQTRFDAAVQAVSAQTARLKEAGAAGTLIELLEIPSFLPAVLKARLREIAPTLGSSHVQTSWLSNLGRLPESPRMGDAGRVQAIWFSPPAHMPMGVSVGAVSLEDRLLLALRYRKAVFDATAARDFGEVYRQVLLG